MGSKLLRATDTERGFSGMIHRHFEAARRTYTRALASTLRYRPVVLTLWAIFVVLLIPLYMFSDHEPAPNEDQSVVFGVVQGSANATIDQTRMFADKVSDVYHSFPETENTFQLTTPTGGFGGMVTRPWKERKKPSRSSRRRARTRSRSSRS